MLRGYYEETVPWNFNFAAHAVHVNNYTGHLAFRRHKLSSVLVSPSDNTGDGQTDGRIATFLNASYLRAGTL